MFSIKSLTKLDFVMKVITTLLLSIFLFSINSYAENNPNSPKFDSSAVYMKNPVYAQRIELYEIYKKVPATIVVLGDSRTDGASWGELLGRANVVDQGIPSDVTEGYLARMQYVYDLNPRYCIIQGGLNDIYNWTPVEKIYQNYIRIINGLRAKGITPILQSVIYAGRIWGKEYLMRINSKISAEENNKERNRNIERLNRMLKSYAKRNNLVYVELNDEMTSDGLLRDDLTRDGVHLNARGYRIWGKKLDEILTELGL